MKNLQSTIIKIAIGIIIGVLFFYTCNKPAQQPAPVTKKEVAANVAVVVNAEKSINLKVDSLNNEVAKRDEHITWLNTNLDASDITISKLRSNQNKAAKDLPTSETFTEENKQEFLVEMETLESAHDTRNATCDSINLGLTKIVKLKDQVIYNKDSLYRILRTSFDTSVNQNYRLIDFTKLQQKKIRNKKIENYLLKAAIIAGGVYILKK
jgi:hypothetical protein